MVSREPQGPAERADELTDVVFASIAILLVALLGLVIWLNTEFLQPGGADSAGPPAAESPTPAPSGDVDGDGDAAADAEGGAPDDAAQDSGNQRPDAAAGNGSPDRGEAADAGLFSADDPSRVPAITVSSAPRDVRVRRVDLDGDGLDERIWAAIVRNQVVVRVEHVVDGVWTPRTTHEGAPADRLWRLSLTDVNDDGQLEVVTIQWVATEGESASLWSIRDGDLAPMEVRGGCWEGGNTFGIVGTLLETPDGDQPTIAAICPDDDLPKHRWPSALYRWDDDHWMFVDERAR